ncbi:MAG: hypothetical protein AAGF72_13040 [Pseudomonadota bacterium]
MLTGYAHVIAHLRPDLDTLCCHDDIAGNGALKLDSLPGGNKVTVDCGPHFQFTARSVDVTVDCLLDQQYVIGVLSPREGGDGHKRETESE